MSEFIWPSDPLVTLTAYYEGRSHEYRSEWSSNTSPNHTVVISKISFYMDLINSGRASTYSFRITVESIDENNNVVKVIHKPTDYHVSKPDPKRVNIRIPAEFPTTRFKVSVEFNNGGIWSPPESKLYSTTYKGKKCFIATAAYGSDLEPAVQTLRDFRDRSLNSPRFGAIYKSIFDIYYIYSPKIAQAMVRNLVIKYVIKYLVVWPTLITVIVCSFIRQLLLKI